MRRRKFFPFFYELPIKIRENTLSEMLIFGRKGEKADDFFSFHLLLRRCLSFIPVDHYAIMIIFGSYFEENFSIARHSYYNIPSNIVSNGKYYAIDFLIIFHFINPVFIAEM